MAWSKTLVSVGGLTSGQHLPYQTFIYAGYNVGVNDYTIVQSDNGQDGVDRNISGIYFDVPYRAGQVDTDYVALAKIPVLNDQGVIVRYIGVRYKCRSEIAFGVTRLSVDTEIGYWDTQQNFTHMGDRSCQTYSNSSTLFNFKLRCHICAGTMQGSTTYDFFGVAISIEATDRAKYVYAGILDARSYVQGDLNPTGDFSPEFGPASEPEGYTGGGFDDHSDVIGLPPKPQSILSLGFLNVYKCAANALQDFGAAMFPEITFPTSLSDVGEVLAAFSDSIWNSKLIDYVVSVHCVPGDVTATGQLEDIKVGARTMTGILARKIDNEYIDFDFGSVTVDPYYNNYADYMTDISLYLPMYGFISLRPEEIIGGAIHLIYRFNVIDGSFQAFVFSTSNRSKLHESLIGQYGGSCVVHLPISNLSYSSMFSSMVGGAMASYAAVASGGSSLAAGLSMTSLYTQAAQGADTKKSNSYNASSSFMSRLQPYVIVTRPLSAFSTRYNVENGLPSNVAMQISSCTGLTICDNPILTFACTDEIGKEIISALKEGIIL